MKCFVIHCRMASGDHRIIGVFYDEDMANAAFDALEAHGDPSKTFYIDTYTVNEIK